MNAEQAAEYYAQLHPETGVLSDKELGNVSGSDEYSFYDTIVCVREAICCDVLFASPFAT